MKFRPRIPGLLGAFIGLIAVLFVAIGIIDYFANRSSARRSSASFLKQTKKMFSSQIDLIINPVNLMLKLTKEQYTAGMINFNDFRSANAVFIPFIRENLSVSSINYGDASGNGYLVLKTADGWKNRIKKGAAANRVTWVDLDDKGGRRSQETRPDDYDPRKRPWYEQALSADGIQWGKPYVFRTTKDLGITASCRISKGGSAPFAAVGMDIILGDLSVLLSKVGSGKGSHLYLLDDDGTVLASSHVDEFKNVLRNNAQMPRVDDGEFELLNSAFRAYRLQPGKEVLSVDFKGESFFAGFDSLALGREKIYLVALVPERVYFEDFEEGLSNTMLIFFIVLSLGSVFFLYCYILPIRAMMRAVRDFGTGVYQPLPETRSDEIGALSGSFNRMAEDILRQKAVLVDSEKRYRLLFQNNPLPIFVFDLETLGILAVNRAAVEKYGYSAEEFASITIKDIRPEEEIPRLIDTIKDIKKSGDVQRLSSWRHKKKDGTVFDVELAAQSIMWKEKTARIVLINDVTEKKQLEEMLRHSQKMESIGQLAGGVAHDFNNILSAIVGYGELLKIKIGADEQLRSYVEHILASSQRAAALVKGLLAFSRKQILNQIPININVTVRNVENLLTRMLGEDISITVNLAACDILVLADSVQMEQVLINLATNARDAMPDGGELVFRTGTVVMHKEPTEKRRETQPLEYAVVTVSDTGAGIDKKTRERIFEPFFTTKEVGKGTGLGLSMAFGIIAQHNGFIDVDSEPGRGTTFAIHLPLLKSDVPDPCAQSECSALPAGGTETVLLAEDDDAVRTLMGSILKQYGYTVIEAADGEEAVRKYRDAKERIQLLLLDVIMPKKNGKNVLDEIRAITPGIKAVFMSGYAADVITQKGALGQGAEFVIKPVTPNTLLRKVRQVLDREG